MLRHYLILLPISLAFMRYLSGISFIIKVPGNTKVLTISCPLYLHISRIRPRQNRDWLKIQLNGHGVLQAVTKIAFLPFALRLSVVTGVGSWKAPSKAGGV
jgi:hypothetical protein